MERYDAIYGRQSADRADSISIESQIEYCQYETRGGAYKVFTDKGYSGKNTERPQFRQMLACIRNGEVKRVIVYRLDRISRSILDFATMMEEFQRHGVEFVSCTEKFDTSTPMGRAMLNICIVFAQLERETVQMRVEDAYISRSRKGFYMGGRIPFGYRLEPYRIDGKKTSRYAVNPDEAEVVRLIYSIYAKPQASYGDIIRYLMENGIANPKTKNGLWSKGQLADMLKNPIYVRADLDIYQFFKHSGAVIHNSPEDFAGTNGCYLYEEKTAGKKTVHLDGQHLVVAPHEGLIASDVWLKARIKCMNNKRVAKPLKAKNTWLAGKIKCGKCGHSLVCKKFRTADTRYFLCKNRMENHACEGVGCLHADPIERFVLSKIQQHLSGFQTVSEKLPAIEDPRIHSVRIKIEKLEEEIGKLLDKVPDANEILMEYINNRINELNTQLQAHRQELEQLTPSGAQAAPDMIRLSGFMRHWDKLDFDEKREIVDQLIISVRATADSCEIDWKYAFLP